MSISLLVEEFGRNLVLVAVFLAVYSGVFSLHYLTTRQRQHMAERLSQLSKRSEKYANARQEELNLPFFQRAIYPVLAGVANRTKKLLPAEKEAFLQTKLTMAGNPGNLSSSEFSALQYTMSAILAAMAFGVGATMFDLAQFQIILLIIGAAIIGNILPTIYLNGKIGERKQNIQHELPDVLDLLTVSVVAGLGFDAALVTVVEKSDGVLTKEFQRTLQEITKGKSRREALRDMAERCQVNDLSSFVGALVQADQLGVSISNVLRLQAEHMRDKRRQYAQERAMKAPVKMLFPLVFFIFPTIFIVLLGPAAIQLFETFAK
jgi:tight adherence protein C